MRPSRTTAAETAAMMTKWRVVNPDETGTGAVPCLIIVVCISVTVVTAIAVLGV